MKSDDRAELPAASQVRAVEPARAGRDQTGASSGLAEPLGPDCLSPSTPVCQIGIQLMTATIETTSTLPDVARLRASIVTGSAIVS